MGLSAIPEKFSYGEYGFTRADANGWVKIDGWLKAPHLSDWWTPDEDMVQSLKTGDSARSAYLVDHLGWPFAYLQLGNPSADTGLRESLTFSEGAIRIDQFIGEADMIGFGHGINFMKALVAALKENPAVHKLVVAPAKENIFAIRSYNQCGFRQEKIIDDLGGPIVMMSQNT